MRCHLQRLDDQVVLSIRCSRLVHRIYPKIVSLVRFVTDSTNSWYHGILYVVELWIQIMQTQSLFIHKIFRFRVAFLLEAARVKRKGSMKSLL